MPTRPVSANLHNNAELSRSVPGIPAAAAAAAAASAANTQHQNAAAWTIRLSGWVEGDMAIKKMHTNLTDTHT